MFHSFIFHFFNEFVNSCDNRVMRKYFLLRIMNIHVPPKHAPKASAYINGVIGKSNFSFAAKSSTIFTITVVNGILSIKLDDNAETHSIRQIATSKRLLSSTEFMQ